MGRYLVVGGAGFVGSNVVWALRDAGHSVVVFDNLSFGWRELIGDTELIVGDIRDASALRAVLAGREFDAVLHFAARIEVSESVTNPLVFYDNNVLGMISLMNAMKDAAVQNLVFSSSAAVYGTPQRVPITEDQPKRPINPYGRTKAVMEDMLADCRTAYGLNWIALRYFNAAGADRNLRCGEWHSPETHLIPNVLMAAAGKKPSVKVFGNDYETPDGTCVRDYVHVADLARAHIEALKLASVGVSGPFNVGTGKGYSVLEIINAAREVTGREIKVEFAPRRAGDPPSLVASVDKFATMCGSCKAEITEAHEIVADAWRWHERKGFGPDRRR